MLKRKKLEGKISPQFICPDCGKLVNYEDIGKYLKNSSTKLLEMDLIRFFNEKTNIFNDRGIGITLLSRLVSRLYDGRLYKEYDYKDNKIEYHKKPITKVKDLYNLTEKEIFAIRMVGRKTWERLNEILRKFDLLPLHLPYK